MINYLKKKCTTFLFDEDQAKDRAKRLPRFRATFDYFIRSRIRNGLPLFNRRNVSLTIWVTHEHVSRVFYGSNVNLEPVHRRVSSPWTRQTFSLSLLSSLPRFRNVWRRSEHASLPLDNGQTLMVLVYTLIRANDNVSRQERVFQSRSHICSYRGKEGSVYSKIIQKFYTMYITNLYRCQFFLICNRLWKYSIFFYKEIRKIF